MLPARAAGQAAAAGVRHAARMWVNAHVSVCMRGACPWCVRVSVCVSVCVGVLSCARPHVFMCARLCVSGREVAAGVRHAARMWINVHVSACLCVYAGCVSVVRARVLCFLCVSVCYWVLRAPMCSCACDCDSLVETWRPVCAMQRVCGSMCLSFCVSLLSLIHI